MKTESGNCKEVEVLELPKVPNVEFFRDAHGEGWYCTGPSDEEGLGGNCYQDQEVIYDRSFGG